MIWLGMAVMAGCEKRSWAKSRSGVAVMEWWALAGRATVGFGQPWSGEAVKAGFG